MSTPRAIRNARRLAYREPRLGTFDADYGSFTGHPMDPRTDNDSDEEYDPEEAEREKFEFREEQRYWSEQENYR